MKGSLIIVGFFALGCVCGIFHVIPVDIAKTDISFYALCALMFSVGLSIGRDPQTLKNFRSLNPRLIFLPVMTILGTVSAAALVSLLLPHRDARRLHGSRSGIRLLLTVEYLHHRVQGSRVGNNSIAL